MPELNLTAKTVYSLVIDAGERVELWDEGLKGFGVRVSRRGKAETTAKTYFVRYRIGTKMRRLSLGNARRKWLRETGWHLVGAPYPARDALHERTR